MVTRMATQARQSAEFDGIICIGGEDWWYHNRGHYDLQIMQRLARRMPVLFVNSLGVRMPSIGKGANFLARVGRKASSVEGFNYSQSSKDAAAKGLTWTDAELMKYLENPTTYMPGTKMAYAGLKDEDQRKDVIAYLKTKK